MIKGLIIIAVIVIVALGAWQIFEYWDKIQNEKTDVAKQAAAAQANLNNLPGLPDGWDQSLQAAEQGGADSLGKWLKTYGPSVRDPRKAWIELDYVVMISRDNPQEAKRIFTDVHDRTLPTSPVWPRIQGLEKSFQ
ncbi:MAG TPA: hypothetical protein VN761_08685 [Candidatus Polarisedimenticolia bacterium]|nr:hypothetical protein [Candidatus Polarisedimenticolia bacterium]